MTNEELQELKQAYNVVFDENGEIKGCGRACTRKLIDLISNHTSVYVGDSKTGMMKVDAIKSAYQKLTAYHGALVL